MKKTAVIGLGSFHGDDQLGWLVIDALSAKTEQQNNFVLFKSKGNGLDWIDSVANCEPVFFVDAVKSDQKNGLIHVFDIDEEFDRVNAFMPQSNHSISIIDSVMIAARIGKLSLPVKFVGVEISDKHMAGDQLIELTEHVVKMLEHQWSDNKQ